MPPPNRIQHPTGIASLKWVVTDDGSRTLVDEALNETYHSGCGAVAETLVVYLSNSGAAKRLRTGLSTVVIEYGFGTATGFLLTAALAQAYRTPLLYYAFETKHLPAAVFRQLDLCNSVGKWFASDFAKSPEPSSRFRIEEFVDLSRLFESFCETVANAPPIDQAQSPSLVQRLETRISEFVQLRLLFGDVRSQQHHADVQIPPSSCDAIYFDPFSPETNPGVWTVDVLRRAANYLKPGGILTSYCVKSAVRKTVAEAGLQVSKAPGPMRGKREVLVAVKP